jgi:hypothetical protein
MVARKAALELKADCPAAARSLIEEAQEALPEPTALWLAMTIEAIRFDLPDKETWLYEKRWRDALKRRCRSETAGRLCELLHSHLAQAEPYDGCQEHTQDLRKYIRRCSRVKWQEEDLRHVCEFVRTVEDEALLAKLVKRGLQTFPQAAFLHLHAGDLEIKKGPFLCDRDKATRYLEQAIQLGTASGDPRDLSYVEAAKEASSFLEDHEAPSHFYDDDEDDEEDGKFDDLMDALEGVPRGFVLSMIDGFCEQAGLDPEFVMAVIERRMAARARRRE